MYGVSNIVELLLITLLLIALVSLLWLFTSRTINAITQSGTNQTQRTQEILSACMIVDSVHGNNIYIKNCGNGVITNDSLNVYLDEVPIGFNLTPQTVGKGGTGTITAALWSLSKGDHYIKITNPSLQIVQGVESVLPDSCILDLEFNEGPGTTAHDYSGNGDDGTLVNGPAWVTGKWGSALSFNGVNNYVNVVFPSNECGSNQVTCVGGTPGPAGEPYIPTSGSYSMLFKTTSPSGGLQVVTGTNFGGGCDRVIWLNGGILNFNAWNEVNFTGTTPVNDGQWHYLVYVLDRNLGFKAYVDGSLYANTTNTTNCGIGCSGFNWADTYNIGTGIGCRTGASGYFNGIIDSVRIYNTALNPSDTLILNMK